MSAESPQASEPSADTAAAASDADRFHSQTEGFTIVKPARWLFATVEAEEANLARVSVGNAAFDEKMRQRDTRPLVVIVKHPASYKDVNPTVKVMFMPLVEGMRGLTPREIAAVLVRAMAQSAPHFKLEGEISETKISGRAAAHFRARLVIVRVDQERSFAVLNRSWIVPMGTQMLVIAMSGPPDGEDVSEAEFAQILRSIEIAD